VSRTIKVLEGVMVVGEIDVQIRSRAEGRKSPSNVEGRDAKQP
jgi:hypothetical protein